MTRTVYRLLTPEECSRADLEYALYLLEAALEHDRKRRWWQLPDRLWWGRVDHARSILSRLTETAHS